jgi:LPXTG-motif cell wall-anchored protein
VLRGTAKHLMRLGAASALAGIVVLSSGSAALAADAVGTVTVGTPNTKVVNTLANGEQTTIVSPLRFTPKDGGDSTPVYCVSFTADLSDGAYKDGSAKGIKNYEEISWLLANSYPHVDAATVLDNAGTAVPTTGFHDFNNAAFLAYVGTQTAIWELSNPGDFKLGKTWSSTLNVNQDQYAAIVAVHDYLVDLIGSTPHPTLSITSPSTTTGTVGTKVGPFTVHSGKAEAQLTVTGGKIVDKDGNEITSLKNNGQFWLTSDAAGSVTVHATATFTVPAGEVFVPKKGEGQIVIAPGSGTKTKQAEATATFTVPESASPTPAPSSPAPGLPVTGANVTGAAIGGGVLLIAGLGLVLVLRRRRVKFTA